ncbi:MAG: DNA mismatch repair endonuclease MutH [Gammaproteobacteria bacterium]|nr:MAG: DNA mismatch repair endonuclease MutH [Gammaproteobacteria bacterium]
MKENKFPQKIAAPVTQDELLQRCEQLAGKTLGQVAAEMGQIVPENLRRHKGWVGNLLESYLGADAGTQAQPDFIGLGIEMKTMPLNALGQPKESTYVCTVPLKQNGQQVWQDSWIRRKLSHVLWLPVEAAADIPLADRYIGNGWLWKPTVEQERMLKADWEELMDRIVLGEQAEITAREGEYLQIRPKAANSRVLAKGVSASGESELINPKGFYLRTSFTKQLLVTA